MRARTRMPHRGAGPRSKRSGDRGSGRRPGVEGWHHLGGRWTGLGRMLWNRKSNGHWRDERRGGGRADAVAFGHGAVVALATATLVRVVGRAHAVATRVRGGVDFG